ncbi:MAG: response regulator [Thermoanaerobaculia bacterium]
MAKKKGKPLDAELAELVPIFVDEVRDRLERLATLAPRLPDDEDAQAEVKRELHTVKGASRMLQVGQIAELAHATEELVLAGPEGVGSLLTRVVDRLSSMVDTVEEGANPDPDPELLGAVTAALEAAGAGETTAKRSGKGKKGGKRPASKGVKRPSSAHALSGAEGSAGEGGGKKSTTGGKSSKAGAAKGRKTTKGEASSGKGGGGKRSRSKRRDSEEAAPQGAEPASPARSDDTVTVGVSDVSDPDAAAREGDSEAPGPAGPAGRAVSDVRVEGAALDSVADRATQVRILALAARTSVHRIYDLARLAEEGIREEEQPRQVLAVLGTMLRRLAVDVESGHRRLLRSAEDGLDLLLTLQLQPLRPYLLHLARYARELGRSLGRSVEVQIDGEETRLDRRIARELEESLLHLVRNAVDHGLEPRAQRTKRNKPAEGQLRLAAEAQAGRVRLTISDDGAGIDPAGVVRQAVRAGLVESGAADSLTREEVFRLLFSPGFSTRRKVSEISGRGVGLDVVASAVNRVGGEVFLSSEPGQGTTVVVEVPVARRGEEVLLVRVGKARLALPSAPIREIVRIDAGDVRERDGRSYAQLGERLLAFVPLARLLGQPVPESQLLLVGRVSGQPLAVAVDEVDGEEEVLVRPMTRSAGVEQALDGMALVASGEPIAVLSPAVLAKRELLKSGRPVAPVEEAQARVRVLLVDDSLVTREMERRLLEDAGFEVTAAADADEGLNRLGEGEFDCLVTDIEMPGMDGYELTRHLRNIPQFAHLPIIVVSTRERPEDRLEGLQAGADAYLTKQALDAGELVDLVRRLSGTR